MAFAEERHEHLIQSADGSHHNAKQPRTSRFFELRCWRGALKTDRRWGFHKMELPKNGLFVRKHRISKSIDFRGAQMFLDTTTFREKQKMIFCGARTSWEHTGKHNLGVQGALGYTPLKSMECTEQNTFQLCLCEHGVCPKWPD